jgi:hypothetical protein
MRVPGELPSVQEIRRTRAPVVVEGKLATVGVIVGIAVTMIAVPLLLGNHWWTSAAVLLATSVVLRTFFRCENCGKRRPFWGSLGGECPHCSGPSAHWGDPIEPR